MTSTRRAYAHDAIVRLAPGGDPDAIGGAVTVALCGHWEHEPPCPLAPHHTRATVVDDSVEVRILFAADPGEEARVRGLIEGALTSGRLTGPDGRASAWTVTSSAASPVRSDEADHAAGLVEH